MLTLLAVTLCVDALSLNAMLTDTSDHVDKDGFAVEPHKPDVPAQPAKQEAKALPAVDDQPLEDDEEDASLAERDDEDEDDVTGGTDPEDEYQHSLTELDAGDELERSEADEEDEFKTVSEEDAEEDAEEEDAVDEGEVALDETEEDAEAEDAEDEEEKDEKKLETKAKETAKTEKASRSAAETDSTVSAEGKTVAGTEGPPVHMKMNVNKKEVSGEKTPVGGMEVHVNDQTQEQTATGVHATIGKLVNGSPNSYGVTVQSGPPGSVPKPLHTPDVKKQFDEANFVHADVVNDPTQPPTDVDVNVNKAYEKDAEVGVNYNGKDHVSGDSQSSGAAVKVKGAAPTSAVQTAKASAASATQPAPAAGAQDDSTD